MHLALIPSVRITAPVSMDMKERGRYATVMTCFISQIVHILHEFNGGDTLSKMFYKG